VESGGSRTFSPSPTIRVPGSSLFFLEHIFIPNAIGNIWENRRGLGGHLGRNPITPPPPKIPPGISKPWRTPMGPPRATRKKEKKEESKKNYLKNPCPPQALQR